MFQFQFGFQFNSVLDAVSIPTAFLSLQFDRVPVGAITVLFTVRLVQEEVFNIQKSGLIPGKNHPEGKIHCLFQLGASSQEFSIIPDGYTSSSMVEALEVETGSHAYRRNEDRYIVL